MLILLTLLIHTAFLQHLPSRGKVLLGHIEVDEVDQGTAGTLAWGFINGVSVALLRAGQVTDCGPYNLQGQRGRLLRDIKKGAVSRSKLSSDTLFPVPVGGL